MKIGILFHSSCGGSARIATDEAAELVRRGHRVHLFTRTPPFFEVKQTQGLFLHTIHQNPIQGSKASYLDVNWSGRELDIMIDKVLKIIYTEGLDIIHVHYAMPFAFIANRIKNRFRCTDIALIATLHGTDVILYGRNKATAKLLKDTLKCFDILTSVSLSLARLAAEVFHLKTEPLVIPNFVDLKHYVLKKSHVCHIRPRLLHVSNFRPVKDLEGMAYIFAELRKRIDAELWLVGDGIEMEMLKSVLKNAGVYKDVRFLGLHSDVASLYRSVDILLMPSFYESFCLAALEAMASGTPVLATCVGGLPEVVIHGKTGFLFPVNDYSVATDLATCLLTDPIRYRSMSLEARRHAEGFDQKKMVSKYEELYNRVLIEKRGSSSIAF